MRTLLGFVAGLALGVGGSLALRGSERPAPVEADAAPGGATEAGSSSPASRPAAVLSGSPVASPRPTGDAVFPLDFAAWERLEGVTGSKDESVAHLWRAMGREYAHAGRVGDLLRLADAEIAAKFESSIGVLWLLTELPADKRRGALDALRKAHPELEARLPKSELGRVFVLCGETESGVALLVEALAAAKGEDRNAAKALAAADPVRADAALWSGAGEWTARAIAWLAGSLASGGRNDLAERWRRLSKEMAGPEPTAAERLAIAREAVREAEDAAREKPEDADRWTNVGHARRNAGDANGAFQAYQKALEVGGLDAEVLAVLLELDPAAALPVLERAAKTDGQDDVLVLLVRAYLRAGRAKEAAETLFRMREIEAEWLYSGIAALAPSASVPWIERGLERRSQREYGALRWAHGDGLLALGQSSRAFDEYRKAFEIGESALAGLEACDPARALPILEGLRRDGANGTEWVGPLADAYRRLGRKDDAIALCEARAADEPVDALRVLAVLDPEKGLARLKAWCANHDANEGWIALGDACRDLGRSDDARAAYGKVLDVDAGEIRALVRWASVR